MSAKVESVAGGIRVSGEMTIYTARQIKQPLLDALYGTQEDVQLDLSGVTDFDTAGVQLVLLAHRETLAAGRQLRLNAESNIVRDTLTLYGAFGMLKDAPISGSLP